MNEAIQCRGVKKTYGAGGTAVHALDGIDLDVHPGELLMLVGPSGSGKTTLLSVISGILSQDAGTCSVLGTDLNGLPNDERTLFRGKHIGFVFQAFNLVPMLTARENTAIPLILNDVEEEEALERAGDLLTQVGLVKRLDSFPRQMSGGEQQRVAIARGCIHKPEVIVCDEPTSALDHVTGEKVLDILRTLTEKTAVVIVTHDQRIFHFADRLFHMEDGRITNGL